MHSRTTLDMFKDPSLQIAPKILWLVLSQGADSLETSLIYDFYLNHACITDDNLVTIYAKIHVAHVAVVSL